MAANNIRVHTDANYRIRDDIAPLMQSSRYFNKNNCMNKNNATLRRNIISDSFVQPYTQKLDDGTCDYSTARQSELEIGNLNYYNRPQNYESQLNLNQSSMRTIGNTKLDQSYNLSAGNQVQSIGQSKSSEYYPYAYGNNLSGVGQGVMGGFVQQPGNTSSNNAGYYEPYLYRTPSNRQLLHGSGDNPAESNFGQFIPKGVSAKPSYNNYKAVSDPSVLSYSSVNPAMRGYAGSTPKTRSKYGAPQPETFVQRRPREGFFFESNVYPINNYGGQFKSLEDSVGKRTLLQLALNIANKNNSWKTSIGLLQAQINLLILKLRPTKEEKDAADSKGIINSVRGEENYAIPTKKQLNELISIVPRQSTNMIPSKYGKTLSAPALNNSENDEVTDIFNELNGLDTVVYESPRIPGQWLANSVQLNSTIMSSLRALIGQLYPHLNSQGKVQQQGQQGQQAQQAQQVQQAQNADEAHNIKLAKSLDAIADEIDRIILLAEDGGEFDLSLKRSIINYFKLSMGEELESISSLEYDEEQKNKFNEVQDELDKMNLNRDLGHMGDIIPTSSIEGGVTDPQ